MKEWNQELGSNIPRMTVSQMAELLSTLYAGAVEKGIPFSQLPAPMLSGPPGLGKSQGFHQLGRRLQKKLNRTVHVRDLRLSGRTPADLYGMPRIDHQKNRTVFTIPEILANHCPPDEIEIICLDELNTVSPSMQAVALQLTLEHRVGEHKLPDHCIVMAAGNRMEDQCYSQKLSKALCNRMFHLEVVPDFDSWKAWALDHDIHPSVVGFLAWQPNLLMDFQPTQADMAFPTPRSWEAVSTMLKSVEGLSADIFPVVAGNVGVAAASEFRGYWKVYGQLPTMEEIFRGRASRVPSSPDALYGVIAGMAAYANRDGMEYDTVQLANGIRYAMKLPPEFASCLLRDLLAMERLTNTLFLIPEFRTWMSKNGAYYDG